ncbi:TetR/AcrR family transcriptional regulator [Rhizosphaericola mali]|uniref:TetR/AcrR family transcriptional regulator n=1 Tax=Rhizosphaericola mali TaxID=2545455 RepID=A0A5P2G8S9_9BACT|nr:TetR/AcrR family transcriptional regulator [Rhizosphaericola mali]QES87931.1 TetR/AcrR family transcriptional regulator [Rhizosphaericola mali]
MASENVRLQILVGAQKLFQQNGWSKITMEVVAKSIGKAKSSLYYYFKSKEEIYFAVLDMEINEIILETIRQIKEEKTLEAKLFTFSKVKFEMTRKRRSLYATTEIGMDQEEFTKYTEIKRSVHDKYVEKEKVVLQQVFIEAIQNKELDEIDSIKMDALLLIFLCGLRGLNREFYHRISHEEMKGILQLHCQVFYKGIK